MGQRLGIASALLGDPATLILDEPANGLDPEGILWIRNLLKRLASEGRTVFLSSHLMAEIAQTAEHLVIIGRGRLIADTSVADILAQASRDSAVRVRSPQAAELARVLTADGGQVESPAGDQLEVSGLTQRPGRHDRRPTRPRPARARRRPGLARGRLHAPDRRRARIPRRRARSQAPI